MQSVPRDLWFAADANRLVAESQTYDDLVTFLIRSRIPLPTLAIAYFPSGALQ
jgi:hypothetical protein